MSGTAPHDVILPVTATLIGVINRRINLHPDVTSNIIDEMRRREGER